MQKAEQESLLKNTLNELILYSGQFALFYIIMQIAKSRFEFFTDLGHIVLVLVLILQSVLLARFGNTIKARIPGTFFVPLIYTLIEIREGADYLLNAAHIGFWIYALLSSIIQVRNIINKRKAISSKLIEIVVVFTTIITFIFLYFYFDMALEAQTDSELIITRIFTKFPAFLDDASHLYIIFGGTILTIILGLGRIEIVKLKDKISDLFGRYVDSNIRDIILKNQNLSAKREELCVMFSDIRNFTHLNEMTDPDLITKMLNMYFEQWDLLVRKHNGVIDKFIGDAVMMIFGLDGIKENACNSAVSCGLDMIDSWEDLKSRIKDAGLPIPDGFGIGSHFGSLIIGDIGSGERRNFTVIGDTVNIASRIEAGNKTLKNDFLISSDVYTQIDPAIQRRFKKIGHVKLKGKEKNVEIWGRTSSESDL